MSQEAFSVTLESVTDRPTVKASEAVPQDEVTSIITNDRMDFDIFPGQRWIGKSGTEYEIVRVVRHGKPRWSYSVQYRAINYPGYVYNSDAFSFYNKHGLITK